MLDAFKTTDEIQSDGDASFGGLRSSDIYHDTVEMAYLHTSPTGAKAVALKLKSACGSYMDTTIYFTSGTAKGGLHYYTTKDGSKKYLPGFERMNDLAIVLTGKEFSAQVTDKRVVDVYNYEAKSNIPTNVDALVDWIGKPFISGVVRQTRSVSKRGDDGIYHPTSETRDENELVKVFYPDDGSANAQKTVVEAKGTDTEAKYIQTWTERHKDKILDRRDKNAPKADGNPLMGGKATPAAAAPTQETNDLFA